MTPVQDKPSVQRQRSNCSIYQVHYSLPKESDGDMAKPFFEAEPRLQQYDSQVAGHRSCKDHKYIGLLQCNDGTILKPIIKEVQRREIAFYETLLTTKIPELVELRQFVSKYSGCRKFTYEGHENDYIILEDLAQRMFEPCVMDVKMGKRTWDPLATVEKRRNEESKYFDSKNEFGFCIPGYQVHKITTGRLLRYGKDHGKKLKGQAVKDAIRNYLNGVGTHICRALLLQFLAGLWKLQRLFGRQRVLRLYSASVLLVYDAARLRECCGDKDSLASKSKQCTPSNAVRRKSMNCSPSQEAGSNFSGQIGAKGPVFKKVNSVPQTSMALAQNAFAPHTSMALAQNAFAPHSPSKSSWSEALERLNQNHSFENNYEDKLSKIKMDYRAMLDEISNDQPTSLWATVKVIDFAHAFFNEESEMAVDENFKEGLDNLVKILEEFLKETDDQLF